MLIMVGQGPIALVVGAARCRLKYCLKGQLSKKQPSNQPCSTVVVVVVLFYVLFLGRRRPPKL